jgi:membrane peptidoglycan carboxypeptidase
MGRLKRMSAALQPPERTMLQRLVDFVRGLARWALRLTLSAVVSAALAIGGAIGLFESGRLGASADQFAEPAIMAIIAQESAVLYADGQTRIGVFFAQEHRQYVPFERLPTAWVDAIVAAEDQRFWEHPGVDPQGIARAMVQNLKAGGLVAGGSSLTQQTAKNLFYRPDRSLRSKVDELANALRLEHAFGAEDKRAGKKKILEFYANQFHVSHNGRGIAIAARYFFDKDVGELDVLECAFIAGLVKAPANYNPFIGATEERRAKARARAQARTGYVLDRMLAMGKLSNEEHARLRAMEIPFRRGVFRYDSSVLLDEVAARLEQAPFPEVFAQLGIDNPSTAGLEVVTTLDVHAQRSAFYALGHHLSEVGPVLEDLRPERLRLPPAPDGAEAPQSFVEGGFYEAVVRENDGKNAVVAVGAESCVIDAAAVTRMAAVFARAKDGNSGRSATAADRTAVLDAIPVGARVMVSLAAPGRCDLELRPELQGAVLLLENGAIRAMVGGSDNQNFNRAVAAKRQLGSTWKPLLYYTALQLGWAPTDPLDNRVAVFPFEGTWYSPRADHDPRATVSLNQAGVASENIASIWLLYHLLDGLSPEALRELAQAVGLVPESFASRDAWIRRVRDDFGVINTAGRVEELAFHAARLEMVRELRPEDPVRIELMALLHGKGAVAEERKLQKGSGAGDKVEALRWNFMEVQAAAKDCDLSYARIAAHVGASAGAGQRIFDALSAALSEAPPPLPALDLSDVAPVFVSPNGDALSCGIGRAGWGPVSAETLADWSARRGEGLPERDAVLLRGRLPLGTLDGLIAGAQRWALVLSSQDAYDFEVLQHHPDFRLVLSMEAMSAAAQAFGVRSPLPPTLSMPLGAVDISLEEAAGIYQGMQTGAVWRFPGEVRPADSALGLWEDVAPVEASTLLIQEIRRPRPEQPGAYEVLYRATPTKEQVAPPEAGRLLGDVLRDVVLYGTGSRAAQAVQVGGAPVPVAGKTGTTNGFKNAAFAGVVPKVVENEWKWGEGYTLVTYVGYDDNRAMRRGGTRLAGASGALPVWIGAAQGLARAGELGAVAPADRELRVEGGYAVVSVAAGTGLPAEGGPQGVLVRGAGLLSDGTVDVERSTTTAWLRSRPAASASAPSQAPGGDAAPPAPSVAPTDEAGGEAIDAPLEAPLDEGEVEAPEARLEALTPAEEEEPEDVRIAPTPDEALEPAPELEAEPEVP